MPIYIVRWPNRSASIIRAADEEHLAHLLDHVGDPGSAIWEEYDGPLWVDLEPRWRQTDAGEFEVDDDFDAATRPWDILLPGASLATYWTILARLFPHLYLALRELDEDEPDDRAKARIVEALEREQWLATADDDRPRRQSTVEWRAAQHARLRAERRLALEDLASLSGHLVDDDDGGGELMN